MVLDSVTRTSSSSLERRDLSSEEEGGRVAWVSELFINLGSE